MTSRQEGFSLLEMLIVLGIIVIVVSTVSYSYWGFLDTRKLLTGAERIRTMVAGARQAAVTNRAYRWLEIDLLDDSLQTYEQEYIYENGQEELTWVSTTGVERLDRSIDITDVCERSVEPNDFAAWELITRYQTKVRLVFNPRGYLSSMEYLNPTTRAWESLAVENPIIHLYTSGRSGVDKVHGANIVLSGREYPYRDPGGTRVDVISDPGLRDKVRNLPADALDRKKCYSVKIYGTTGRPVIYEYGIGYPWSTELSY